MSMSVCVLQGKRGLRAKDIIRIIREQYQWARYSEKKQYPFERIPQKLVTCSMLMLQTKGVCLPVCIKA